MKQMVTFKMEKKLLRNVDAVSKEAGYSSRTDFIRNALRDKVEEQRIRTALITVAKTKGMLKGSEKTEISDENIEKIKEQVAKEYARKFGMNLD